MREKTPLEISKFIEEYRQANGILDDLSQHEFESNKSLPQQVEELEIDLIRSALFQTDYNISKSAVVLGISRELLHYKIKKYQKKL